MNKIKIAKIIPNPDQPRKSFTGIDELAESIKEKGLLEPLVVRPVNGGYEIVAGERRFRACKQAGLDEVECVSKHIDQDEAYQISLLENMQRENLTPIEEAEAFQRLSSCGMKHDEIAKLIGKGRSYVSQKLRLLNMPEFLQHFLQTQDLSENHIRQILKLKKYYVPELKAKFNFEKVQKIETTEEASLFLNSIRPDDESPALYFQTTQYIVESVNIFIDYVQNNKIIYQWEVGALWWACFAAKIQLSVSNLSIALNNWWERYASAILCTKVTPENFQLNGYEADHNPDGSMHWKYYFWFGWLSDLRHNSSDHLTADDIPNDWMIPLIKKGTFSYPSSMQDWAVRGNEDKESAMFWFHKYMDKLENETV